MTGMTITDFATTYYRGTKGEGVERQALPDLEHVQQYLQHENAAELTAIGEIMPFFVSRIIDLNSSLRE